MIKPLDGSIIVTTPQDVALLDSRKSVNFSRMLEVPVIGVVENMSGLHCPECGHFIPLFKVGGGEEAAKELNVPFLGRIPIDPEVVQDSDNGTPYVLEHEDTEATKAYEQLAERCVQFVQAKAQQEETEQAQ
jgi:MinD-like ATPase involved in chromosome partitioning or flagellar assembly